MPATIANAEVRKTSADVDGMAVDWALIEALMEFTRGDCECTQRNDRGRYQSRRTDRRLPLPYLTSLTPQHILNVIFGERESEAIGLHIRGGSPPPCPLENLGCCCANVAGVAEVFFRSPL
jgi:hypothetical protein